MADGKSGQWLRLMRQGLFAAGAALVLASCTGAQEEQTEREGRRVREDVRGMRDFLYDRGVTIDTRLPER
ncbi:MAG: hypothetical protein KIT16_20870 [Rhodospirillaceae bacterium]|nr:hypothetical protein [Rhodospirillaceae bacterium]